MNVILTSPDALIDKATNTFFPNILEYLELLLNEKLLEAVVVISSQWDKIDLIPDPFIGIKVKGRAKRDGSYLNAIIASNPDIAHEDIIVLGASQSDFFMSTNSKHLLFTAHYARKNNPHGSIFKYGIPISSPSHLLDFSRQFLSISPHCYYELHINSKTSLYAINSANTYHTTGTLLEIKEEIKNFLKENNPVHSRTFLNYFLMCGYSKISDLRNIDYWGVYPSSGANTWNTDLVAFKEEARKIYKTGVQPEVLIRQNTAKKRHRSYKNERISDGCNSQFNTIIINPKYKGKLQGKTVCIIDDFTTYGSSCETARILLKEAGIGKLIFITMGKFGREYFKQHYDINGDVFDKYTYKRKKMHTVKHGKFYSGANTELQQIFGNIAS